MSDIKSIDLKSLHVNVMQEFQTDEVQKIDTDYFRNLSSFLGNLKNEEYDGVENKIKTQMISFATKLTELLLNKRLEKTSSTSYSILTDEEKFIIDSNSEMDERKEMVISGIINGKSKFLEITSTKHKTKPITVRFVKESDEIIGADSEKYGPFKPEDVATVPNETAQALISNGVALKVRIEE